MLRELRTVMVAAGMRPTFGRCHSELGMPSGYPAPFLMSLFQPGHERGQHGAGILGKGQVGESPPFES